MVISPSSSTRKSAPESRSSCESVVGYGPPTTTGLPVAFGAADLRVHVRLLNDHRRHHDDVGPVPLFRCYVANIAIDEFEFPILRQDRRDGDQSQRREHGFSAHEFDGVIEGQKLGGKIG